MKVVIKILFFILAMFSANICEAKVFSEVVTQIRFIENAIENKNEVTINLENDIAITCKSQSDLLVYRNWAKGCEANAAKGGMSELSALKPTHYLTRSKSQMQNLVNDIRANGIKEAIDYVEFNGQKYIVGGNHRYFAAQKLGIQNVPVIQRQLPFAGYRTPADLMLEGKMPGYWKYIK